MKLVVDTNVLITFFWKGSVFRRLLADTNLELFSPEYALREINKNSSEIVKRRGISLKEFKILRRELTSIVEFIPLEGYSSFLDKAMRFSPDKEDVDFLALALKLKYPFWSNDRRLKKQTVVDILNTEELIKLLK